MGARSRTPGSRSTSRHGPGEAKIEALLKMMRTEPDEELGELAALKNVVQTPNRIRCATLAWDALERGLG